MQQMTVGPAETDSSLAAAARSGDKQAFGLLITRHRPLLQALCWRSLGDHALAEDAAHEAILQAMLNLDP
jgi:DNA-directed RNA polymerase specialized sigma24 family protein